MTSDAEKYETHRMLYGTTQDEVTEALFLLGAREKETLAEVARRRMRELGLKLGEPPISWRRQTGAVDVTSSRSEPHRCEEECCLPK